MAVCFQDRNEIGTRAQMGVQGRLRMQKAKVIACLDKPILAARQRPGWIPDGVDALEMRADILGDVKPGWLRTGFAGELIFALRSEAYGGKFDGPDSERAALIGRAAREYEIIELESDRDCRDEILSVVPPERRIISWYCTDKDTGNLGQRLDLMTSVQASMYKIVTAANRSGDELAPLCLLKEAMRRDVVAYARGERGFWTRLLAPRLGAPAIFATAQEVWSDGGEPPASLVIQDYGLPYFGPVTEIYGIAGNPVRHSLSPRLHNAAYRALGRPALFVPFYTESFPDFWRKVVISGKVESLGMSIKGMTVASPHKEAAIGIADEISSMARRAWSSNVFRRSNGDWVADTTDPEGVALTLKERGIDVRGKRTAVVGCGGAGRAIAAALDQAGAKVVLVNRGAKRARLATELLGLPHMLLSEFSVRGFAIVINATPVGRDDGRLPFELEHLADGAVLVDLVYGRRRSPLVANAIDMKRTAIDGRDVLFVQARRQFELMTGSRMPESVARKVLGYQEFEMLPREDKLPASEP
jgi:3-dehydroquinate dehydratase/shikimate dehydrogenase